MRTCLAKPLIRARRNATPSSTSSISLVRGIFEPPVPSSTFSQPLSSQTGDPLSGTTCSNTNIETFQLSVDEVCAGVDTEVKLLTVPIGQVFDGYASEDGKS